MTDDARKSDRHYAIGNKNPNLPFHPAVRAGDYIFVSGQVPKDENNDVILCVPDKPAPLGTRLA